MGAVITEPAYETLKVRVSDDTCVIQIHRPDANNTINEQLIEDFTAALDECEDRVKVVVVEGSPEVFCFGADFKGLQKSFESTGTVEAMDPGPMYDLWLRLATGPYITIAHVRGQANAGGIGFVAACDIVICEEKATFSLSELLFGLMPACVLPFLIRRTGIPKANYMTVMTEPISAKTAQEWGLVDELAPDSQNLLRKKLLRLRRLSRTAIQRYKRYMNALNRDLANARPRALEANLEVFSDRGNMQKIARFVTTGQFPWDGD
ncbi:MAG TPA: enoyl-CoA hydratase/isomerase [Steroidobacteraceae bacterium]|nr:enoyl-CoA hydratase/isomerase [Steroidobacteraceae bacterium]